MMSKCLKYSELNIKTKQKKEKLIHFAEQKIRKNGCVLRWVCRILIVEPKSKERAFLAYCFTK